MSEIYGRSRVLQFANLFYLGIVHSSPRTVHFVISGQLVWNLACGFAQNEGQFIAFRLLAGLGGSGPLAVRRPTPYFFICRLTASDRWRRAWRCLAPRTERESYRRLLPCPPSWTSSWTSMRRMVCTFLHHFH
jgi:MFS family permease